MDDLLSVFIAETAQSLDEGELSFKAIQKAPGDHGAIDNLLRLMNSIRETSGFLGLPALNAMAVMAVDQLTQLRSSKGTDAWERIPAVKESLRVLRTLLRDLAERSGAPVPEAAKPEPKSKEPVAKEPVAKEPKPAKEASAKEPKAAKEPRETKAARTAKAKAEAAAAEEADEEELPRAKPAKAAKAKQAPAPEPVEAEPTAVTAAPVPPPAPLPEPPSVQAAPPAVEQPVVAAAPQPETPPSASTPAPMAGAVVVQAQTLETLLSTVNNLMAAQAEMIQLMRSLGVTMPRGGSGAAHKSSARPPSEPRVLANRPRVDNGAQPAADATTRTLASATEETTTPGNVVRLRDRRSDSGPETPESAPLPPVKTQMMALEEAAETRLDDGAQLQLFSGAHGRIRTVDTSKLARIVEVDLSSIDSSRSLWMAEVDELLVPLVLCDRDLVLPERGTIPIIVLSFDGQWLGLMTAEIGAVARAQVDTSYADLHAGRAGLATVNGQDLEVIEPAFYLAEALRQRTRGSVRRAATKQKHSTAAATAIMAEADDLFVRKPGH